MQKTLCVRAEVMVSCRMHEWHTTWIEGPQPKVTRMVDLLQQIAALRGLTVLTEWMVVDDGTPLAVGEVDGGEGALLPWEWL